MNRNHAEKSRHLPGGAHRRNAVFAGDHRGVREHATAVGDHCGGPEEKHRPRWGRRRGNEHVAGAQLGELGLVLNDTNRPE
jgi:hypothetical protein